MKIFKNWSTAILTLALICGQLIKVPLNGGNGLTILDLTVICLVFAGLIRSGFKFKTVPRICLAAGVFFIFGGLIIFISPLHLTNNQILTSAAYSLRYLFYLLLGLQVINRQLPWKEDQLTGILLTSGTALALLGLLQLIFIPNLIFLSSLGWDPHYFRTASTLLDPNFLGVYLTLTLLLLLSENLRLTKKLRILLFVINYLALLTTFSRSSAIMFALSFLAFALVSRSKKIFLLTILLILGFGLSFLLYRQLISAPRNINRTQSASYRLGAYQEGLSIAGHSPIFGVGFNTYRYALAEYQLADSATIWSHGGTSNDSSLLFVLATTGVLGTFIYLWFMFEIVKAALANRTFWGYFLISILAGLLINSLFINTLFYPWIFLWLTLIPTLLKTQGRSGQT